ncbi:MAG TPA: SWIM zinc finger family protein, partial [Actinoplanes sp.]|nr:SWIM zinc finger family protein [Actinoplanes sp.]
MPVERWSPAQVSALAPDASSLAGARSVGGAGHWLAAGRLDEVLWGLCRGSGRNPYQVCVDLSGPAYTCSCPSRKSPCKHALGLLLRWAEGRPLDAPPPPWVGEWVASRAARAAKAATVRSGAPADPAAAARRAQQRAERVAAGMAELRQWLDDQVQQGLAGAAQAGHRPFDAMAARLVDAQAPAAASAVRRLGTYAGIGQQWADRLLGDLGLLRLLVAAHERLDTLPAPLAATVRTRIGFPVSSEDVLAGARVRDRWQVLGQVDTDDGALITRRTWLHGADGGRFALLLAFAAPGQTLATDVVPGTELDADLCFYPGALPMRALVAERYGTPRPLTAPAGAHGSRAALAGWTAALAAEPWRYDCPVLLAGVVPSEDGWLIDPAGEALPLAPGHREPWWLLAAAGGAPATVAAEWSPSGLRPLAAWANGRYVPADLSVPEPGAARQPELPPDLLAAALVGTARRPWTAASVTVGGRSLTFAGAGTGHEPAAGPGGLADAGTGHEPAAGPHGPAGAGTGTGTGTGHDAAASRGVAPPDSERDRGDAGAGEPGGSLLEVAAAALVYRRAGVTPWTGQVRVSAAPAETDAPLPGPAGARLLRILSEGAPGGANATQELLAQWLAAAARRGGFVPPEALPALLDAGRRNAAIRTDLGRVAGRRGTWLAGIRMDWRWLLDEAPGAGVADDPAVWQEGSSGERLAYLVRLRGTDAAAARELLEKSWAAESSEDRVRFIAALEIGLSPTDDTFLDRALDDRRREVREAALELLRLLPGSSLGRRMAVRAEAAVRLERRAFGRDRLLVDPPDHLDAPLRRDGAGTTPARGAGINAWLLEEIVAGTPLDTWTARFDRSPGDILELIRGHDWETPLLHGWAKAAIAQRDGRWAGALVANDSHNKAAGLRDSVRW